MNLSSEPVPGNARLTLHQRTGQFTARQIQDLLTLTYITRIRALIRCERQGSTRWFASREDADAQTYEVRACAPIRRAEWNAGWQHPPNLTFYNRSPTHELETKLSGSISRRPRLFLQRMSLSGRRFYL